jgi:hypothetical protein
MRAFSFILVSGLLILLFVLPPHVVTTEHHSALFGGHIGSDVSYKLMSPTTNTLQVAHYDYGYTITTIKAAENLQSTLAIILIIVLVITTLLPSPKRNDHDVPTLRSTP